jgi:hypothetical protein
MINVTKIQQNYNKLKLNFLKCMYGFRNMFRLLLEVVAEVIKNKQKKSE